MNLQSEHRLRDCALRRLRERPRTLTYSRIAAETGLAKDWLESLGKGRIKDPACSKVLRLYEYLSGITLPIT
jgi:predicted transcriptional regulator